MRRSHELRSRSPAPLRAGRREAHRSSGGCSTTRARDVPSSSKLEGLVGSHRAACRAHVGHVTHTRALASSESRPDPEPARPRWWRVAGRGRGCGPTAYFLTRPGAEAPKPQAPVVATTGHRREPESRPATAEPAPVAEAPRSAPSVPDAKVHAEPRGTQAPSSSKVTDASAEAALLERAREAIATDPSARSRSLASTRVAFRRASSRRSAR